MKKNMRYITVIFLFVFGISAIHTHVHAQSNVNETVIGTISGRIPAGEIYTLYKSSADSFREYFAGWQLVGERDRRVTFTYDQLYEKCLNEAKKQYGKDYPNLYLKNLSAVLDEMGTLPDEVYHSGAVGSSTEYKKTERIQRVYIYSAIVVVAQ